MQLITPEYDRRIEWLRHNIDFQFMLQTVSSWMIARPPVLLHNGKLEPMRDKNVPGEIDETLAEVVLRGTKEYSARKEIDEALDIIWFLMTIIFSQSVPVDFEETRRSMNGYGQRSDVFDLMYSHTAELTSKNLEKELSQLLAICASYLASIPRLPHPTTAVMNTLQKDSDNYPAEVYSLTHSRNGKRLTPDQLNEAYTHIRKALKTVRRRLKDSGIDCTYGMRREDWLPYKPYIENFWESDRMMTALQIQLDLDYPVLKATKMVA